MAECYECGEKGHMARICPHKGKGKKGENGGQWQQKGGNGKGKGNYGNFGGKGYQQQQQQQSYPQQQQANSLGHGSQGSPPVWRLATLEVSKAFTDLTCDNYDYPELKPTQFIQKINTHADAS